MLIEMRLLGEAVDDALICELDMPIVPYTKDTYIEWQEIEYKVRHVTYHYSNGRSKHPTIRIYVEDLG